MESLQVHFAWLSLFLSAVSEQHSSSEHKQGDCHSWGDSHPPENEMSWKEFEERAPAMAPLGFERLKGCLYYGQYQENQPRYL